MRAAETLIARSGIENVTIRDIVSQAGQKNTSALQYHFGNLDGLIAAIHAERSQQTQTRRADLLAELLADDAAPDLRQLCALMVRPAFDLAREHRDFCRYVRAFGHELALSETSALARVQRGGGGGSSGRQFRTLLQAALPHLDDAAWRRRMEAAVRLCAVSMYYQARVPDAFRGDEAELFYHGLLDALVGLLSAPESDHTRAIAKTLASH